AMDFVLSLYDAVEAGEKISVLHGRPIPVTTAYGAATILPLYHPAVALYSRKQRPTLDADFQVLRELLHGASV
ncbi:MAG: uracil-DNA glycosylase, partial [Anaerolineae bacterium]